MNLLEKRGKTAKIEGLIPGLTAIFELCLAWFLIYTLLDHLRQGLFTFLFNIDFLLYIAVGSLLFAIIINKSLTLRSLEKTVFVKLKTQKIYFLLLFVFFLVLANQIFSLGLLPKIEVIILCIIFVCYVYFFQSSSQKEDFYFEEKIKRVLVFLFSAGASLFLVYALYLNVNPLGMYSVTINPENIYRFTNNSFIYSPEDNLKNDYFNVAQSPLQLVIPTPGKFETATVSVEYKNNSTPDSMWMGVKHPNGFYVNKPAVIYSSALYKLPPYWLKTRDGDYVLFEKNKELQQLFDLSEQARQNLVLEETNKFQENQFKLEKGIISQQEFYTNQQIMQEQYESLDFEQTQNVAQAAARAVPTYVHAADFVNSFRFGGYTHLLTFETSFDKDFSVQQDYSSSESKVNKIDVRGSHTFLFFQQKKQDFRIDFSFQDSNRNGGADDIKIILSQDMKSLKYDKISDQFQDGTSEEFSHVFEYKDLDEGFYRIEVKTTDDIFLKKFLSNLPIFGFEGFYYSSQGDVYPSSLQSGKELPVELYTNSKKVSLLTTHMESLQRVSVGGRSVLLDGIHKSFDVDGLQGVTKIIIPNGDMKVTGDGVFTYTEDNPLLNYDRNYLSSSDSFDLNELNKYDYIYAYLPEAVEQKDGWLEASVTFPKEELFLNNNESIFSIDFGKSGIDSRSISVKSIDITFKKDPLTFITFFEKIRDKINPF